MNPSAIEAALAYRRELERQLAKIEQERASLRAKIAEVNQFIATWEKFAGQPVNVNATRTR